MPSMVFVDVAAEVIVSEPVGDAVFARVALLLPVFDSVADGVGFVWEELDVPVSTGVAVIVSVVLPLSV